MLLDANVLIALFDASHVHHRDCAVWLSRLTARPATCALTELALMRWGLRVEPRGGRLAALAFLNALAERADYLDEAPRPVDIDWKGVIGHNQVTDAFLVATARAARRKLATLDRGLAAIHGGHVEIIPTA